MVEPNPDPSAVLGASLIMQPRLRETADVPRSGPHDETRYDRMTVPGASLWATCTRRPGRVFAMRPDGASPAWMSAPPGRAPRFHVSRVAVQRALAEGPRCHSAL